VNDQKKIFLQVSLPDYVVDWIDLNAEKKVLKRGPTCRLVLIEALSNIDENELPKFQFVFSHKVNLPTTIVAFEITKQMNEKLLNLCKYIPVSKKKLAEILICQKYESSREV